MAVQNKGSFSSTRADQDEQQKKAQSTAAKATAEKLIKPAAAPTKQRKDISALGSVKAGTWGQKATVKMPSGREVQSGGMTIPKLRTEAQREANRQTREAALTSLRQNLNKINTLQIKEDQPDNAQRLTVGIKPEQQYKRIIQPLDDAPLRIQSDKTWAQLRENLNRAHTYNDDGTVRGNALVKDLMMGPMDFNNPQTIDQNRAQMITDAQNAIETGDYSFFNQPDSQYAITRPDDDILNGTILTYGQSLIKNINKQMGFHGWEPPTSDAPEYNYNNAAALEGITEPNAPGWIANIDAGSTPGNNQLAQLPINRAIDNMITGGGAIDRPRTEVERKYRAEAEKQWDRVKRAYIEDTPYFKERSAQTEYELNSINAEIEAKKAIIDDMENNGLTGDVVEENKRDYRRLLKQRAEKRFEQNQLAEETEAVEIDAGRLEGNLDDATRLKYGLNSNIDVPQNSLFGQILQHSERIRMIGSAAIQNKAESIVNDSCLMVAAMGAKMAGYDNIYEYYDSLPEGAMKTTAEIGINPYMSSKNGGYDFGGETWNWIANQYDNIVSNGLDHFMRLATGPVGMIASAAEWFTQNYAEQTREAYEMGASQDEAHVSGFIAGLINTAANTVLYNRVESSLHELGSKLTPEMQRLIPKGLQNLIAEGGSKLAATASAALTLGQSAFEEGAEEVVEDAVKSIATIIAYDHSADFGENWDEFRRLMNEQHNWKEDFVAGAANGLLMDLFMGAYNSSYNGARQNVSTAVNPQTIGNLTTIVEAFGLEENDPTRQSAEQLLTKLRRGEPISTEEFNGIENGMQDAARNAEKTPEDIQKHVPIWIQRGKNPPMELDEYMHSAEGRLEAEQNRNGAADSMQDILNQANAGTLDLTTPEGQRAFEAARAKLEEAAARLRQRIADQQAARDAYYAIEDAETENERAKADIARQVGEIAAETISEATNGRAINQAEMTNDAVVGAIDGIKDAVINQLQAESAAQDAEQERQNAVTPTEESEAETKLQNARAMLETIGQQIENAKNTLRGTVMNLTDYKTRLNEARSNPENGIAYDQNIAQYTDEELNASIEFYSNQLKNYMDNMRQYPGYDENSNNRDFNRLMTGIDETMKMMEALQREWNLRDSILNGNPYTPDTENNRRAAALDELRQNATENGRRFNYRNNNLSDEQLQDIIDTNNQRSNEALHRAGMAQITMEREFYRDQAKRYDALAEEAENELDLRREFAQMPQDSSDQAGNETVAPIKGNPLFDMSDSAIDVLTSNPTAETTPTDDTQYNPIDQATIDAYTEAVRNMLDTFEHRPKRSDKQAYSEWEHEIEAQQNTIVEFEHDAINAGQDTRVFENIYEQIIHEPARQQADSYNQTSAQPLSEAAQEIQQNIINEQQRRNDLSPEERERENQRRELNQRAERINNLSEEELRYWGSWIDDQINLNQQNANTEDEQVKRDMWRDNVALRNLRDMINRELQEKIAIRRRTNLETGNALSDRNPQQRTARAQKNMRLRRSQQIGIEAIAADTENGLGNNARLMTTDTISLERAADTLFSNPEAMVNGETPTTTDAMLQDNQRRVNELQTEISMMGNAVRELTNDNVLLAATISSTTNPEIIEDATNRQNRNHRDINLLDNTIKQLEMEVRFLRDHAADSVMDSITSGHIARPLMDRIMGLINHSNAYKTGRIGMHEDTPQRVFDNLFGKAAPYMRAIYIDPIQQHESERQAYIAQARETIAAFKLNRAESALVQMVGEGIISNDDLISYINDNNLIKRGTKLKDGSGNWNENNDATEPIDINGERLHGTPNGVNPAEDVSDMIESHTEGTSDAPFTGLNANDFDAEYRDIIRRISDAALVFRKIYGEIYDMTDAALVQNGYSHLGRIDAYFPHFDGKGQSATTLQKIAQRLGFGNPYAVPTSVDGISSQFKPNHMWSGHILSRYGSDTKYDALQGFEAYVEGITNIAFHTADIKRIRQLINEIRAGEDNGTLDSRKVPGNKAIVNEGNAFGENNSDFGNLVVWLTEYANQLAGKKSNIFFDRTFEYTGGRKVFDWLDKVTNFQSAAQIFANVSTALSNTGAMVMAISEHPISTLHGIARMISDTATRSNSMPESNFLTRRFGSESLSQTFWQKLNSYGSRAFEAIDELAANIIVRGNYYANIARGMDEEQAMRSADAWAARIMADRSKGAKPNFFGSRTFMVTLGRYQLEVTNQLKHEYHDLIKSHFYDDNGKMRINVKGLGELAGTGILLALLKYLYNEGFERITGHRLLYDPINVAKESAEAYQQSGKWTDAVKGGWNELSQYIPYIGGGEFGTGAVQNHLEAIQKISALMEGLANGNYDDALIDDAFWAVSGYMPGGSQFKKTYKAIGTLLNDGYYTEGGQLLFPLDSSNPAQKAQALIFGQWATEYGHKYLDENRTPLSKPNTELYTKLVSEGADIYTAYDKIYAYQQSQSWKNKMDTARKNGNEELARIYEQKMLEETRKIDDIHIFLTNRGKTQYNEDVIWWLNEEFLTTGDSTFIPKDYDGTFTQDKIKYTFDEKALDNLAGTYNRARDDYLLAHAQEWSEAWKYEDCSERRANILKDAIKEAKATAKETGFTRGYNYIPADQQNTDTEIKTPKTTNPISDAIAAVNAMFSGSGKNQQSGNEIMIENEPTANPTAESNTEPTPEATATATTAATAAPTAVPTPPPAEGVKPGAPRNPITGSRTASAAALAAIQSAPGTGPTDLHASKTRPSAAQGTSSDTRAQFGADMPEGSAVDLNLLRGQVNPKSKSKNPAQYGMARDQNGSPSQWGPAFRPELGYNAAAAKKNKVEWGKGKEKTDTATSDAAKAAAQMMTYGAISNGTSPEVNAQGYLSGERPIGAPAIDTGFKIVDKSEVDQNSPEYWRHYWKINDYVKRITGIDHIDYKTGELVYAGTGSGSGKRSSKSSGRSYRKSSGSRKSSGRRSSGSSAAATGSGMTGMQALEYAQQLMTGAPQMTVSLPSHLTTLQNYFGAGWTPAQIGTGYQNPDGSAGSYTEAQINTKQAYYNHLMDAYFAALGDSWESASAEEKQEIYNQLHAIADARADELMREEEEEAQPNE